MRLFLDSNIVTYIAFFEGYLAVDYFVPVGDGTTTSLPPGMITKW